MWNQGSCQGVKQKQRIASIGTKPKSYKYQDRKLSKYFIEKLIAKY